MRIKVAAISELPATLIASVRFDARVSSDVHHEVIFTWRRVITPPTLVIFDAVLVVEIVVVGRFLPRVSAYANNPRDLKRQGATIETDAVVHERPCAAERRC